MRRPFAFPVLPTYLLLLLVLAFALASAWLDLARLDAVERHGESGALSAATIHDLQALQGAIIDVETSARGFLLTGDATDLDLYERARLDIPRRLSALREDVRDDPGALVLVEKLVPLVARRTDLAAVAIDEKRAAPDRMPKAVAGRPGKEATEAVRAIIAQMEERERAAAARDRQAVAAAIDAARRDLSLLVSAIVLLVILLFFAVRRLKSLLPPVRNIDAANAVDIQHPTVWMDGHVATLLQDALLRTRLAYATTPADSPEAVRLRSLLAAMEHARDEHLRTAAELNLSRPQENDIVAALWMLAESYSKLGGPIVKATVEKNLVVRDRDRVFLVLRAAEWGLEAVALRKRSGEITLLFSGVGENAELRIMALPDQPDSPLRLSPKETDEANVLQQAATLQGGSFAVSRGPTGFALLMTLPVER